MIDLRKYPMAVSLVKVEPTISAPGRCPLETAYGHGGVTRYCNQLPSPGDVWCSEHLHAYGYPVQGVPYPYVSAGISHR